MEDLGGAASLLVLSDPGGILLILALAGLPWLTLRFGDTNVGDLISSLPCAL